MAELNATPRKRLGMALAEDEAMRRPSTAKEYERAYEGLSRSDLTWREEMARLRASDE